MGEGAGGVEEPLGGVAHLAHRRRHRQIPLGVLDSGFEDVQQVVELVELRSGNDELVLGQADLGRPLAPDVLLLAA